MRKSALIAALLVLAFARTGRAAEPDQRCKVAKDVLGAGEVKAGMTGDQCQQAMDAAEEERWQLWIDIASADEVAGDTARAALSLARFVDAADARERPLPAQWVVARDQARATIARLDGELLKTKGRVTIDSVPAPAVATIVGGGAVTVPEKGPKTPFTAYFTPGSHTVRLRQPDTDASREVTFSVVAGATVALKVDLRPSAPPTNDVAETPGPPVLGQRPVTETGIPPDGTQEPTTVVEEQPGHEPDNDHEGPPIHVTKTSLAESLGTVGIAAGGAAILTGITFALVGSGLDDEASCHTPSCDAQPDLRSRIKRDADVSWNRATGTLVVGVLLVAGGVVALVLDHDDDAPAPVQMTGVTPWIGPDGAGLSGQVTF